jgi:hypothetical protein
MTKQQQIAEMMSRNSVSDSHGLTPPFWPAITWPISITKLAYR